MRSRGREWRRAATVMGVGGFQGMFGGAVGLGGGVVALPLLKHGAKFTQHEAGGMTLPAVFVSGLAGGYVFYRKGEEDDEEANDIRFSNVALVAGSAALASPVGARLAHRLKGSTLSRILGSFILLVTPLVLFKDRLPHHEHLSENQTRAGLVATGCVAGLGTGLLGVGGGVILVPLLSLLIGHQASLGTSLFSMLPPTAVATLSYHKRGCINWRFVPFLMVGAAAGSYLSADWTSGLSESQQRKLFAAVMIPLGIATLVLG